VRCPEVRGDPQPFLVDVEHGNPVGDSGSGVGEKGADATGADDHRVLAGLQSSASHGVDGDAHRLGRRGRVRGEAVWGDLTAGGRRDRAQLGKAAVAVQADGDVAGAEVGPATSALAEVPQEIPAPVTTRSPGANPRTCAPTSRTTPVSS
jgi:hypothetical protein